MKYQLELTKWKCGPHTGFWTQGKTKEEILERLYVQHSLGEGFTGMLNELGFMCCLGHFGKQKGLTDTEMFPRGMPGSVANVINRNYDETFVFNYDMKRFGSNELAEKLSNVNDGRLPIARKIQEIGNLLKEAGHEFEVLFNGEVVEVPFKPAESQDN